MAPVRTEFISGWSAVCDSGANRPQQCVGEYRDGRLVALLRVVFMPAGHELPVLPAVADDIQPVRTARISLLVLPVSLQSFDTVI